MAKFLNFQLQEQIFWHIKRSDPSLIPLKILKGWKLVNPRDYYALDIDRKPNCFLEGGFWVSSKFLCFSVPNSFKLNLNQNSDHLEKLDQLMKFIRLESRQARMSPMLKFAMITTMPNKSMPQIPPLKVKREKGNAMVSGHFFEGSITINNLKNAIESCSKNSTPDTADELLLDAISARLSSDWTKAILYSAIAMETHVGQFLDQKYDQLKLQIKPFLRTRKIQVNSSDTVYKDSIFQFIRERGKFENLIGELSEYLMKKSLKYDETSLYKEAISLYQTRNSIAHEGIVDSNKSHLLPLNETGALKAINTATKVLSWYGAKTEFPEFKMGSIPAQLVV